MKEMRKKWTYLIKALRQEQGYLINFRNRLIQKDNGSCLWIYKKNMRRNWNGKVVWNIRTNH
jgi:hypothetical protein